MRGGLWEGLRRGLGGLVPRRGMEPAVLRIRVGARPARRVRLAARMAARMARRSIRPVRGTGRRGGRRRVGAGRLCLPLCLPL
ncbi:hypothetical protein [Microbispora sp. H11081]|uniref:hypothetical protein n=1 Tax=Microbispora sp. H11081 TaxID=2729107 RepID=UPI001475FB10|nr:hypothetical protein [Microbispora sp. H11081]